ncbi:MAG: ABC transporter substrate-binding protein [Armatimonadetes bacterium]|nr:ABC transporter substrate-binding protein [Armatimonadota bacterium]
MSSISSFGFQSFTEKNIKTPKDFEGHSLGLQPGSMTEKLFPILAKVNGVDVSKVRIVPLSGDVYVPAFLEGRIDIMSGFYDSLYQVVRFQAEKRGKRLTSVWAKDWKLDTVGSMTVAREKTLREQPDLVRRFLRASKRALDATRADPPQALAAVLKHNPELNPDITQGQLQAFLELMPDPEVRTEKTGCALETKVQRTAEIFRQAMGVTEPVSAAQVFTNEFMEWCR